MSLHLSNQIADNSNYVFAPEFTDLLFSDNGPQL